VRFIEPMECLAVDKLPIVDTRLAGDHFASCLRTISGELPRIGRTVQDI